MCVCVCVYIYIYIPITFYNLFLISPVNLGIKPPPTFTKAIAYTPCLSILNPWIYFINAKSTQLSVNPACYPSTSAPNTTTLIWSSAKWHTRSFFESKMLCWLVVGVPNSRTCVYARIRMITYGTFKEPLVHVRFRWIRKKRENTAHNKEKKKQTGSAVLWLLAFPRGKQLEFPAGCIGTRKLSNL